MSRAAGPGVLLVALLAGCPGPDVTTVDAGRRTDAGPGHAADAGAGRDGGGPDAGGPDAAGPDAGCDAVTIGDAPGGVVYRDGVFQGATPWPLPDDRSGTWWLGTDQGAWHILPDGPACQFTAADGQPLPTKTWRALKITLRDVTFAGCDLALDAADEAAIDQLFTDSLATIETDAFQLLQWDVTEVAVDAPLTLVAPSGYPVVDLDDVAALDAVVPGDYDVIVLLFRGVSDDCTIDAPYFGLAYGPEAGTHGAGIIQVQMPQADIPALVDALTLYDPGVLVHEWLHIALENHFGAAGAPLPAPDEGGSPVHNATAYGYEAPWMDWYRDLIRGTVPDDDGTVGIGPAWLPQCTVREQAAGLCAL